jgi:hypothetical protein
VSFLSLGILWAGYQLTWYGYCLLRGPGLGFMDLVLPSRENFVDNWLSTPVASGTYSGDPAASPGTSASSNPSPQAVAGAQKAGIPVGQKNTTDPNKPIFIAPSGQGISGYITNN